MVSWNHSSPQSCQATFGVWNLQYCWTSSSTWPRLRASGNIKHLKNLKLIVIIINLLDFTLHMVSSQSVRWYLTTNWVLKKEIPHLAHITHKAKAPIKSPTIPGRFKGPAGDQKCGWSALKPDSRASHLLQVVVRERFGEAEGAQQGEGVQQEEGLQGERSPQGVWGKRTPKYKPN